MLGFAERRVCRVLGQPRSTQRYQRQPPDDEAPLTAAIIKWPVSMAAMGIDRSPGCCGMRAGGSITSGWNASGGAKG